MRSFDEILQEHWDDAEGEMTYEGIIEAHQEFMSQFDENDKYMLNAIEDPFDSDSDYTFNIDEE